MEFKKKRILLLFFSIFLCFFGWNLVNNIGLWLYKRDHFPEKLDVICTFEGDDLRKFYSLEIYRQYKPIWIVSTADKNKFIRWAQIKGIDMNNVVLQEGCKSTLEEIKMFKNKIDEFNIKKFSGRNIIVGFISSHYHMRRISIINSIVHRSSALPALSLPVPIEWNGYSMSNAKRWWKYKVYRSDVLGEIIKIIIGCSIYWFIT